MSVHAFLTNIVRPKKIKYFVQYNRNVNKIIWNRQGKYDWTLNHKTTFNRYIIKNNKLVHN